MSVEQVTDGAHKYLASSHTPSWGPRWRTTASDSLFPVCLHSTAESFMDALSPSLLAWPSHPTLLYKFLIKEYFYAYFIYLITLTLGLTNGGRAGLELTM